MAYSQYTLGTFTSELASALSDPNLVYWTSDEIARAICEGLLYWGGLTSYWTARGSLSTTSGTSFYDLSALLFDSTPALLRRRAYTLGNLTTEIQYHLFENPAGTSGSGMTDQFAISQITNALIRRRNQFVIDSRIPLTAAEFSTVTPPDGRVALDQTIAVIQRAAWKDGVTGLWTPLRRTDPIASQSFNPIYNLAPGLPFSYSQAEGMPLSLDLIPPPVASGDMHLIYGKTIPMAVADGTTFAVPDEFACALKYGALYELTSTESPGFDPLRAKYCMERYTAAIAAAGAQHSVLRVLVNGRIVALDALENLDCGRPSWMSQRGLPNLAACAFDLLGLSATPNAAYSVIADVSATAPIPAAADNAIQIGREEIPYLFDYCRHILMLKVGGDEFTATMPLYDNFLKGAAQRNTLIGAKARYLTPLFSTPKLQEEISHAA